MAIVWVIEDPKQGLAEITRAVIGNYAVRCIASYRSFKWLHKIEKRLLPDVILINAEHFWESDPDIFIKVSSLMEDSLVLNVDKGNCHVNQVSPRKYNIIDSDFSKLNSFIGSELSSHNQSRTQLLAYKDIQLNMGDFSYRIAPKEDFDSLSNLEFKLLRLFVKNPNKCFNRNELIEHIWDRMKVASRTVDSQISRLRKRLNDSECQIESVYGGGYRLI